MKSGRLRASLVLLALLAACAAPAPAPDGDATLARLRSAAESGRADAQLELSLAFTEGVRVPRDEAKAFFWMREAATRGSEEAMTYLARMYANGVGTARDPAEALRWLKAPLARLDPQARAIYGQVCWASPGACEIRESERSRIVGVVLLTFAMYEKCRQDQRALHGELGRAFAAWRSRNFRYVEFALTDPAFGKRRMRLLESAEHKRLSEAQCRETVASLDEHKVDIDYLRAQPRADEPTKEQSPP